jgi:hypothetical protein
MVRSSGLPRGAWPALADVGTRWLVLVTSSISEVTAASAKLAPSASEVVAAKLSSQSDR